MGSEFKVGDLVAVYQRVYRARANVIRVNTDGTLEIRVLHAPDGLRGVALVHQKQCRRLKLKPKKPPREWWVSIHEDGRLGDIMNTDQSQNMMPGWTCVHVREVRKKK